MYKVSYLEPQSYFTSALFLKLLLVWVDIEKSNCCNNGQSQPKIYLKFGSSPWKGIKCSANSPSKCFIQWDLFKAQVQAKSPSDLLLVGKNTKNSSFLSAARTTPGSRLILPTAFAEWGWLPGLALNSSSKDCSHSSGWANLSCNYTASYWQYSKRPLGRNLQVSQEAFSLIHLNMTIQFPEDKNLCSAKSLQIICLQILETVQANTFSYSQTIVRVRCEFWRKYVHLIFFFNYNEQENIEFACIYHFFWEPQIPPNANTRE